MSNVFVFRRPPHGVITEYFGGGKGGSTTTTNNVTQIPPEVLARYNAVNARAETVAQAPYQSYSQDPNAFVAPLSQTQQAGIQNTNAMAGAAQPYYGAATGLAAQSTGSVNPSALNVGQYMNPFTQSVVNATQAAMNQQQGQQLSQQQAEAIKGGAFGGERAGLQRAQLMGQQGLAQAQAIAPLYQQNYNQALAAAQQQQGVGLGAEQANRQNLQNAATLFGSIGTNAQQAGLAGAQAQLAAGQTQQQTQQAGLQALYNQFQQQQGFPYQQAQFLANIAEGTGALSGNATSGTSTTTGGGGFFSDERLKENIQRVGETDDGQPIYRYNYKGDKNTQIGLLAQDVEKHHPEAVGLAGGYKTVNYKKATEDAVHKDGGGEVSGLAGGNPAVPDTYRIDAPSAMLQKNPSAMLQENSGKGLGAMPSLPQAFQGGRDIPIEAGANAADVAARRDPTVTGYARGVPEGYQAELDSLLSAQNQPPGPNGDILGSGPQYRQSRINTLQDWLNKNASPGPQYASAGGLVGPEGGAFAQGGSFSHGGLAGGGYTSPALEYYGANRGDMFAMGPYGVAPRQSQQRQLLQGTKFDRPAQQPQRNAIDEATKIGQFGSLVKSGIDARPDFLRSAADVAVRERAAQAADMKNKMLLEQGKAQGLGAAEPAAAPAATSVGATKMGSLGDAPMPVPRPDGRTLVGEGYGDVPVESYGDIPEVYAARGGLIGDRHHYSRGGINPYGGLGGGNDILGPVLEDQEQQTQPQMMKAPEAPGQKPQQKSGGLGELVDTGLKARSLYKGGEWAAGKLGLTGPETAMSATSTEALPGVIGAAVPATETAGVIGAAAPEALTAAIPETVASAAEFLPMLFGIPLKDGGVVPRRHYATTGSVPVNIPEQVPEGASSRFGTDVGQPMTEEDKANALIKTLAAQTIAEKAPVMERRPVAPVAPVEASAEPVAKPLPARPVIGQTGAGRAPFQHFASKILPEDMNTDTKSALTSENLWVPALAGVGAMLASPNKTLAGAIGSGLVGGTSAYTGLQKQQSETDLARAEERAKLVGAAKASVEYNKEGFPTAVFVSDGMGGMRRMPFIEAYRNRDKLNLLPDVLSEIEGYAQAHPEYVREAGAPKAPAAPAIPVVPAVPAPGAAKPKTLPPAGEKPKTTEAAPATTEEAAPQQTGAIVTSNEGGDYRYAVEPKKNGAADKYFGSMGAFKGVNLQDPQEVQTIIQSDQNLSERAKNDAKIAEDIRKQIPTINRNMADLHTLSSSINKIGDKGFTQRGAGQESRAALANLYNTTARVMGIPNMQMIDANSDISNTEIINKIQSLSSPEIAKGAGFHAAGIADSIRNAMPGGRLTLEAANTILASMYSEMQKMRDFDKYYDAQTRRYGTGLNAYGNFTNDMAGVYGPEKEAIKKALMAHEVVPKEGEKYRQSYGDVVRKDPRASVQLDKMFKSPGFARYWSDN